MVHFEGIQYRSHTSCISEDQKYQGALYKGKNKKVKLNNHKPDDCQHQHQDDRPKNMAMQPFVEDIGEDRSYEPWNDSVGQTEDERSPAEGLPEAPTPPAAASETHVNVFDYLVATGQTPNASNMNLPLDQQGPDAGDGKSLLRYESDASKYLVEGGEPLVQYGSGPVQTDPAFVTPGPKTERRRSRESQLKKDKKRKRLHVDVPGDQIMTDAPPVLHSGLTGSLKGLLRPAYPPSPDYSGGDAAENSPASPLKSTIHLKHSKRGQPSNGLLDIIANSVIKSSKKSSKKHSHRHADRKEPKLIEYRPQSKDSKHGDSQMVVFKPHADAFLSMVNKGPESGKSCSMNKALRRFHRARQASGSKVTKAKEEKELWRSLRLRRNDRGEVVVFSSVK
ncbi:Zinc finger, C2H2, LYAR-type [Metarhizium album ARSEF 1941]|uniref:Zinc finger, C2H2, LYAR-type n=1 Tax=Metarhizium album (strain ARSEF 1941) TaxID=1081103 RepID=A0A0B2WSI7_METAS|nr:Zinc finger, C2H2, LYAR-type [Metarhizium album ARSEF 1941]KHN96447.1 Zinc finger, C2H2, LYAR-type [Metarhizium album ARSEF 1941]